MQDEIENQYQSKGINKVDFSVSGFLKALLLAVPSAGCVQILK